uniref:Uncharacterized protein n=1 Tax=Neogobius melanostomus TaxID=47308 RepID=A0A8C6UWQ5_9GOBI
MCCCSKTTPMRAGQVRNLMLLCVRRLWKHVTEALRAGNMDEATEHKRHLEERQRNDERQRTAIKTPWTPKHFNKQGEGWVYNRPLWETH